MFRMTRISRYLIAMALVALATTAVFVGCGKNKTPFVPVVDEGITAPNFLKNPWTSGGKDGAEPAALTASFRFDHNPGGTFTFDRYTVYFPPKFTDVAGVLTLTITIPDPAVVMCDLSMNPTKASKFKKPVTLTTSYAGTNGTPGSVSELWYNPGSGLWEQIPSTDNGTNYTVSTDLMHFSRYALAVSN